MRYTMLEIKQIQENGVFFFKGKRLYIYQRSPLID